MENNKVELYIYDLSLGLAKTIAPMIIGKNLEGIWHTSIVVYNKEYMFGSDGIQWCTPASTHLGKPLKVEVLGYTEVPFSVFSDYITSLAESTFSPSSYNLFKHNCNTFSEELAQILVGRSIPKHILDLPDQVLSGNLPPSIIALLSRIEQQAHVGNKNPQQKEGSPEYEELNSQVDLLRYNSYIIGQKRKRLRDKLIHREQKRQERIKKALKEGKPLSEEDKAVMADAELVNGDSTSARMPTEEQISALEEEERQELEALKNARDPPLVFKGLIDVKAEFNALIELIDGKISPVEQRCAEELSRYMIEDDGSWALSDDFLIFVGRLFEDTVFSVEVRTRILNILSEAALKDDVILLLHQDRKNHVLMNYAFQVDKLSLEEQKSLSLFITNIFENPCTSEWLLYISEWNYNGQQISNIRVTTKVAVHCLLCDDASLQERGVAIIYNLACKEVKTVVFDDIAVELTMAILEYFNKKPSEEQLFYSLKTLAKFIQISRQDVPSLIQMIGPDPKTFTGTSPRIDQVIEEISSKLR